MNPYIQVADAILQKLGLVLQEMALEKARGVKGISLDASGHVHNVEGGAPTIEALVNAYRDLLGPAGISFAKDAVHPLVVKDPSLALPQILK